MEWLILLVLVPAIVMPIVLLFGFAGCSFNPRPAEPPEPPAAPTVTATPKNVDHITVSWQNNETEPVTQYRFVRKLGDAVQRNDLVGSLTTTIDDTVDLSENTEYTYEVSTITATGTSDPGTATVRTFRTAFEVDPGTIPPQTVLPDNYCFVQRIPAPLLAGGAKVGIKVLGAPAGNVTINSISISRAAGAGNPWDSAADLTPVTASSPEATPKDLEPVDYSLDPAQDLIIVFDFTASPGAANLRFAAPAGVTLFFKQGVQQALVPIRDPDYITQPDPRLYFVATIGVQ